jgi:4-aminobutyrate aminotransferase
MNVGEMSGRTYEKNQGLLSREDASMGSVHKIRFYPFVAERAEGVHLWDADGNQYLDLLATAGTMQTGYRHPRVREAVVDELDRSWSNMFCVQPHPRGIELAERLCKLVPGGRTYKAWFGATGSDANDCLVKLVPAAANRRRIISFVGAYHGQTYGSASVSGHSAQAKIIGLGNVTKVPYPYCYRCLWGCGDPDACDLQCLHFIEDYALGAVSPANDTAAILVEALQSDGGDIIAPIRFLQGLRELCDRYGIWLLFDEVKTGLGRTGKMFAFEHSGVIPDGISLGKPVGGGMPLSAVVAREEILNVDIFSLYTLAGSPVACAAGLATLDVIEDEHLMENATRVGAHIQAGLRELARDHPSLGDIRGLGLMIGFELVEDRVSKAPASKLAAQLAYRCFELGLVTWYCGALGNVIEMTPPLTLTERDADEALAIYDQALADCETGRFDDAKLAPYAGW